MKLKYARSIFVLLIHSIFNNTLTLFDSIVDPLSVYESTSNRTYLFINWLSD